jgi:hypothetical protein
MSPVPAVEQQIVKTAVSVPLCQALGAAIAEPHRLDHTDGGVIARCDPGGQTVQAKPSSIHGRERVAGHQLDGGPGQTSTPTVSV